MRVECAIEDCAQESRGRGLCGTHWRRWKTWGDPYYDNPKQSLPVPDCKIDDCDKPKVSHGYCPKHLYRWKTHGDPLDPGKITGRPLKGDLPTYAAIHKRVDRTLGKARDRACAYCGLPAQEWSYNGQAGTPGALVARDGIHYSLNLEDYSPACRPCHRQRDLSLVRPRDLVTGRFTP